jgi:hypothetical protein
MRDARSKAAADRIGHQRKYDRDCPRLARKGAERGRGNTKDRVGAHIDQLFRQRPNPVCVTSPPANLDTEIAAVPPSKLGKCILKRGEPRLCSRVGLGNANQNADQPPPGLLCAHSNRPHRS